MNKTLLLLMLAIATVQSTPPKYYQCGQSWSSNPLGNGPKTICQIGCAMTSLAMIMANQGVQLNKALANPGTLNTWLTNNGGYSGDQLLNWWATNPLSSCKYGNKLTVMSQIIAAAQNPNQHAILNVHKGGHWVLATGFDSKTGLFSVNDPGSQSTYTYPQSDVSQAALYNC